MRFELSGEQRALAASTRHLLARRWSGEEARKALDAPPATIPGGLWRELVDLGWPGLALPEAQDGGGLVTACVVAEEAGRALLPGPLLSASAAAVALAVAGDHGDLLTDLVAGVRRATLAVEEPGGASGPDAVRATATPDGDGLRLEGTKILVPDVEGADVVLVAVQGPGGPVLVAVPGDAPGLTVTPMRRIDAQAVAEIVLGGVRVPAAALVGRGPAAPRVLSVAYDAWTVLLAADLLGTARWALETTTSYARERVQFGRPIGSFQAVSHRLADVCTLVELGWGLVYGAALAHDEGRPEAPALAWAAKAWTSDAAVAATEAALQLHGGIGFTWELDVHLYLRRARAGAVTLGTADAHRDRLARYLEARYRQEGR
ncbi:MAG: acyl-CoA dehydrogenase family protein [Acidimicrobiia bacterium]|nr:acyl-CoA dehydrogenase family protein [Acidimicrobiia bacterium]